MTESRIAVAGGLATTPLIASICGAAAHWNVYLVMFLFGAAIVLWVALLVQLGERMD